MKVVINPILSLSQSKRTPVVTFQASAETIAKIATIDRARRDAEGILSGFQRPQIRSHIAEIQDYLELDDDPILPNAIVLGFPSGARVTSKGLEIDVKDGPPGWIVDGQQRFTAASRSDRQDFPLLVSAFLCETQAELQKHFILINSTRPLPRDLIYEILPAVDGLPPRLSDRAAAALLVEALNYRLGSPLRGQIRQHTNRAGVIKDTVMHKVVMASLSDGALSMWRDDTHALLEDGFALIANFFGALRIAFASDWDGHTPKTSRLVHGAGLVAMGYVMDALAFDKGAQSVEDFLGGLEPLVGKTAFTGGEWKFTDQTRLWNTLQNTSADYQLLSTHLVSVVRRPNGLRLVEAKP
jgi:DGQHR domain-containing protein